MASTPGLTNEPGLPVPTGLSPSPGLAAPGGGLSFSGFNPTPAEPLDLYWGADNLTWDVDQLTWGS